MLIHRVSLLPLLLIGCLLLGGCSFFEATSQIRGNKVDADQLKGLVPGTSTRADVTALIGLAHGGRRSTTTPGCTSAWSPDRGLGGRWAW